MTGFRLASGTILIILGVLIIGRSLWVVLERGMGWSALMLPILVGGLMIGMGVQRWRAWWAMRKGQIL
jgi:NADH:ubiquinone oxidoreductase subunit 6 (subunit J)